MSERVKVLDKSVKDKIDDCLNNLREMKEIEIQLKQSCGVDPPCMTTSNASAIDSWLETWKDFKEMDIEVFTCLISNRGSEEFRRMKIARRFAVVSLLMEIRGIELPPHDDANIPQLEAFHDELLQDQVDVLEEHLCKIRVEHRLLADKLRSKFV
ncbi:PREDICTED: uncharacterized protein LOC104782222 [Camelina sativa]|uniref:Uncharacterized protein LOC104782222 n=1 Tax=Camelina sativa TaxID=90675 RepID=A0ABM0YSX1_CAMSA|nr:PREDICTED: uncharacterized protein LOC104782222 [Camelina sativa]